jgi:hypothetical protein
MLLYTASFIGAFFGTGLWPRAHPFFFVWMLLLLTLWVERRQGRYVALAVIVYAAGMYWYMEMAPALLLVPILYFLYRPPVGWKAIVAATAVGVAIWSPYLIFETSRNFEDLRELVTVTGPQNLPPIESVFYNKANHLVKLPDIERMKNGGEAPVVAAPKPAQEISVDTAAWGRIKTKNEECMYLGEVGYIFFSPKIGWAFQSYETGRLLLYNRKEWEPGTYPIPVPSHYQKREVKKPTVSGILTKAQSFSPTANFGAAQSNCLWLGQFALAFCAAIYVFMVSGLPRRCADAFRSWRDSPNPFRAHIVGKTADTGAFWTVLFLGATGCTVIMALIIPHDGLWTNSFRFWWLWVAQAALLGCALGAARARGRWIAIALGLALVASLGSNTKTVCLLRDTFSRWPGNYRGPIEQVLDTLAAQVKKDGLTSARIGYDCNTYNWGASIQRVDGVSKCFVEWDVALRLRHGIVNLDTTAEGIDPRDDYRLFSTDFSYDKANAYFAPMRWSMTLDGSLPPMDTVAETGEYRILRARPLHSDANAERNR